MKLNFKLIAVAGFVALIVAACDSQEDDIDNNDVYANESFSYDISVSQRTRFRLNGINGNVQVDAEPGRSSVSITGERRVGSNNLQDAEEHLGYLEVIVTESASEVSVRTEQPDESRGRNYVVNYEITVPTSFAARINNVNGNVSVTDVEGDTRVELVNGNVDVDLQTAADGDTELSTVNGNVGLSIPRTSSATFSANVVNGNINVSGLDMSDVVTGENSMTGVIGDGEFVIDLETVNGNIDAVGHN